MTICERCKRPTQATKLCGVCERLSKMTPPKTPKYQARWTEDGIRRRIAEARK